MLQHGEWKLFCIITDWQYDNRSLKMDDSCGITAPCTRRDEWVLQVLPEWAPISQESSSSPQINTRQLFTISANLASLYKATCFQWPQSANVKFPLGGFAAAGKCQVKMPCKIYAAPQQRKGQETGKCPCPDVCELTHYHQIHWSSLWYPAMHAT